MEASTPMHLLVQLRWSDMDANYHVRHSVYYDLCSQQRIAALASQGLTMDDMQRHHFGPVLFREECLFKREIRITDEVWIDVALKHLSRDHRKFTFVHAFAKADGVLLATLTVDGAWMDTQERRIVPPPPFAVEALDRFPRTADFTWL